MAALTKTAILHSGDDPGPERVDWESCIKLPSLGQAFESGKGHVDDFMAGGPSEARYEARATGVVVGVAPVWVPIAEGRHAPSVHTCL